jgi:dUTP pyrophosphatase
MAEATPFQTTTWSEVLWERMGEVCEFRLGGILVLRIKVKKLHGAAQLPRYAHTGAWGDLAADLYACEAATLEAGQTLAVPTGIALELPSEYGALVEDRSGLAMKGLTTLAGVIDPGYRGEIRIVLTNLGAEVKQIAVGDRIAQLRLVRRFEAVFEEEDELVEAPRGAGGFGSTGL